MQAKVLKPFFDNKEQRDRRTGDIFDCSEERYNEILSILPNWLEPANSNENTGSDLTRADLVAQAKELGINVPKKANKARINELIQQAQSNE